MRHGRSRHRRVGRQRNKVRQQEAIGEESEQSEKGLCRHPSCREVHQLHASHVSPEHRRLCRSHKQHLMYRPPSESAQSNLSTARFVGECLDDTHLDTCAYRYVCVRESSDILAGSTEQGLTLCSTEPGARLCSTEPVTHHSLSCSTEPATCHSFGRCVTVFDRDAYTCLLYTSDAADE